MLPRPQSWAGCGEAAQGNRPLAEIGIKHQSVKDGEIPLIGEMSQMRQRGNGEAVTPKSLSLVIEEAKPPLKGNSPCQGEPIKAVPFRGKWQMHSICRKGLKPRLKGEVVATNGSRRRGQKSQRPGRWLSFIRFHHPAACLL